MLVLIGQFRRKSAIIRVFVSVSRHNLDKSKGIFEVELSLKLRRAAFMFAATVTTLALAIPTYAQHQGGEANLVLPNLKDVTFLNGINGHNLLLFGIVVCVLGLGFGLAMYMNLQRMPVHRAMREISELIYATCKTYLTTQGKFILLLEAFIAVVIILYFGVLSGLAPGRSHQRDVHDRRHRWSALQGDVPVQRRHRGEVLPGR